MQGVLIPHIFKMSFSALHYLECRLLKYNSCQPHILNVPYEQVHCDLHHHYIVQSRLKSMNSVKRTELPKQYTDTHTLCYKHLEVTYDVRGILGLHHLSHSFPQLPYVADCDWLLIIFICIHYFFSIPHNLLH